MRLRAIGRQIIIRMDFDLIDAVTKKTKLAIPQETLDRLKGGCQISTVLDVGQSAFDDEPPEVATLVVAGRQIVTARYPGHAIDIDPMLSDSEATRTRIIGCSEVRALIALEEEDGTDV